MSEEKRGARKTLADILRVKQSEPDVFYNNLYTNQMASSIEIDEDEPASGITKRRRERQQIAEIHGAGPPSNKESALVNLLKVMIDLLRVQANILRIEKSKEETGQVEGYNFTISSPNVIHIDFVDVGEHRNLPTDVYIGSPGQPLFTLTIRNDAGADIRFNINKEVDLLGNGAVIKPGEHATIEYNKPKIAKLNIALVAGTGSTAAVRIMGVL